MDDSSNSSKQGGGQRPLHARAASNPAGPWRSQINSPARFDERSPLARSYSTADIEAVEESLEYKGSGPVAGGTIMGIHNLAIVFPQFIVRDRPSILDTLTVLQIAVVASVIFKLADNKAGVHPTAGEGSEHASNNGVAWVLRFGGLMALVGPVRCRLALSRPILDWRSHQPQSTPDENRKSACCPGLSLSSLTPHVRP